MTFYLRISVRPGSVQMWKFRCPLERMEVIRVMRANYPECKVRIRERQDKLAMPRQEDTEWIRKIFATV